jgi:hypothetical protein
MHGRICTGCGRITPISHITRGRCPTCARDHARDHAFYNTTAWRNLRAKAKARDGNRCRRCGKAPTPTDPLVVHHIKPRTTHPTLARELANLISLHRTCHGHAEGWQAAMPQIRMDSGIEPSHKGGGLSIEAFENAQQHLAPLLGMRTVREKRTAESRTPGKGL